ncbi:hypothetical protein BGX34_005232, partial [Mortierella sp. NVP85]
FYDLPLEALDNPAITALIEYKWYGVIVILPRFPGTAVLCIFYVLVIAAVLMQVYDSAQSYWLKGVFIAITALTSVFLLLELQQFLHNPRRYLTSPYNLVDLVAFALPLAGSICQIFNIADHDDKGNIATLSFSVLFIFLHILFELRVHKNICHFVAIIIRIIGQIRVFFSIFASGILAFTIAIVHLLYACPVDVCPEKTITFPKAFHRAISTTYFFMGGVWDSVSDDLESGFWTFHVMMILYFFFTTILLLNVLIGFREAYNYFPDRIYYFGTRKEQKEYNKKYSCEDGEDLIGGKSIRSGQRNSMSGPSPDAATSYPASMIIRSYDELKLHQEDQHHKDHKAGMEELKKELKHEREQSQSHLKGLQDRLREQKLELQSQFKEQQRTLQEQLREQQQGFEKQMADMKEMLAAVLASKS